MITPLKPDEITTLTLLDDKIVDAHFDDEHQRYINRELSWLAFNSRVLAEACNNAVPLLERVRYLSISANNLDEFTMVRIAGLKDQIARGSHPISDDGLTPAQQLELINSRVRELMDAQQKTWLSLKSQLHEEDIEIIRPDDLSEREEVLMKHYFETNMFPLLTPIAVDPAHPFPFVPNLGMALVCELKLAGKKTKKHLAMVPMPLKMPRFVLLERKRGPLRLVLAEDVITYFIEHLFPGYESTDHALFRIVRDSDLDIEDEAEDFIRHMDSAVKKRRHGKVVRVKTNQGVSEHLKQFMLEHLPAHRNDVVEVEGMVGLSQLAELLKLPRDDLKFAAFKARFPERVNDFSGDCFAAIAAKDLLIHHPFESFDVVVQFLEQAAEDPHVVSIKQTLYRTTPDSPIVKALIHAAEQGKAVTALVELKARFDEEANIRLARSMERAGISVVYGFTYMKTHAKISLITRQEDTGMKSYAHFGTGNYHSTTAKIYTDLSFFTCDAVLCREAAHVFNYITGYGRPRGLKKLAVAPVHLRKTIRALIAEEIANAKAGKPAAIWAKMNALIDPKIIDALYAASQAGVQIDLVVRGMCALRPGIKGFSDNIRVKSIIGRFLEHSRMFAFANGHELPSPKAKVFISSADWMTRNFDHRVEVLVPIENPTVHAQILDQILTANLKDERQSWRLHQDGSYTRFTEDAATFAAHDYFMHNPSLSGRGKALQQLASPGMGTANSLEPAKKSGMKSVQTRPKKSR